jgi:hypothetical protein
MNDIVIHSTDDEAKLVQAAEQFKRWRENPGKGKCIPQELWKVAVALSKKISIWKICKALKISYEQLRKQIKISGILQKPSSLSNSFIEIPIKTKAAVSIEDRNSVLEFENPNGFKMRIKGLERDEQFLKKAMELFHQVFS